MVENKRFTCRCLNSIKYRFSEIISIYIIWKVNKFFCILSWRGLMGFYYHGIWRTADWVERRKHQTASFNVNKTNTLFYFIEYREIPKQIPNLGIQKKWLPFGSFINHSQKILVLCDTEIQQPVRHTANIC